MAWLAVEKNGDEYVFDYKPYRENNYWFCEICGVELPQGTIKKIIGRNLTWDDDPVEIT